LLYAVRRMIRQTVLTSSECKGSSSEWKLLYLPASCFQSVTCPMSRTGSYTVSVDAARAN